MGDFIITYYYTVYYWIIDVVVCVALMLKVHYVVLGEDMSIRRERSVFITNQIKKLSLFP